VGRHDYPRTVVSVNNIYWNKYVIFLNQLFFFTQFFIVGFISLCYAPYHQYKLNYILVSVNIVFISSPGPKVRSRWTIAITWCPSVVCKLFTFQASSTKPLGQLEPNLAGMFLGWSSTKFLIFVPVGYSTWLPGPKICSDWLKFQRKQVCNFFKSIIFFYTIFYCRIYLSLLCTLSPIQVEWLSFNTNSAIFQLYHGDNKSIFNEMIMRSVLDQHVFFLVHLDLSFREEDLWNFSQSKHIIGPGSHVEYPTGTKIWNFVEDHPRNIPAKFGSNWPSGFDLIEIKGIPIKKKPTIEIFYKF
jgi:hypothetical protein